MLSDALTCSPQLFSTANPNSFALLKVVEVSATEDGHQHLENFMGCTVSEINHNQAYLSTLRWGHP